MSRWIRKSVALISSVVTAAALSLVAVAVAPSASALDSCAGVSSAFISNEAFANLSVTGNGSKNGSNWNTDNTDLTFRYADATKACQKIQVSLFNVSSGLNLTTPFAGGSSTQCESGPWTSATNDHGCFITLDNTGTATFHVAVSGAAGKSLSYMLVGPGWSSAAGGGSSTITFVAGSSPSATPTSSSSATSSAAPGGLTPIFISFGDGDTLGTAAAAQTFGGGVTSTVATSPRGDHALKFVKGAGDIWSGLNFILNGSNQLTGMGNARVSFDYYSPDSVTSPVEIKLMTGTAGSSYVRYAMNAVPGWNSISVDFSTITASQFGNASGWSLANAYKTVVIYPDFTDAPGMAAHVANTGQAYYIDNFSVNGGTTANGVSDSGSTVSPTATASATPSATPTPTATQPASATVAKIALDAADFSSAAMVTTSNGWWRENADSNSIVKYVVAGSTLTLHYTAKDASGNPVSGAQITLAQDLGATYTGNTVGTTGSNGRVTFTLLNTNTNANAESYRSDLTVWSDPTSGTVERDFVPYVTSAGSGACYGLPVGLTACVRDRLWTHIVPSVAPSATPTPSGSASPTPGATPHVKITLSTASAAGTLFTDVDGVSTPVGNTWWHGNGASNNYVKYVEAGSTLSLSYNVKDANGVSVGAGTSVTLTPAKNGGDVAFTGSLTATTNASGIASFTLINTNTNSTSEYRRANMTQWSDVPAGTTEYKYDLTPSVTGSIADVADLLWTHTVSTQMATSTPTPSASSSATSVPNGCSGSSEFIANEAFSNLTVVGNGTKTGSVLNADNSSLTFQYLDGTKACKTIQIALYDPSTGLTLSTATADNSSTACANGPWPAVATPTHSCYIMLDSAGKATFTVAVSGTLTGASFKYSLVGPGWDSAAGGGIGTITYAGGATPTATASATATASPTTPLAVNVKLTSADAAKMFTIGNGWWRENANSNSFVKYVPAGSTLTLHYVVTDESGSPISGAGVTLETLSIGSGAFTGTLSGTTNASGAVTFTVTNTNVNPSTESARSDYSVWSDSTSATVEMDFLPTVSGATSYVGRDRVWTHIVPSAAVIPSPSATATPTPSPTATTNWIVRQTTFTDANSTNKSADAALWVGNGWYHSGLGYREAHVTVGAVKTITYHVTDGSTTAAGRTVTLVFGKQYSNSTANVTVSGVSSTGDNKTVTGVTNSTGDVSFTITNTDSAVGATKLFTQVAAYVTDPAVDTVDITDVIYDAAPTPTYSAPGAPTGVAIKAASATSAVISWTAPSSDGGSAITGYTYTVKNNGVAVAGASATVAGTSATVTGLVAAGKYSVSVTANNIAGSSEAASSFGTISPSATAAKAPGAPTLVKTVWAANASTQATVYWTAPALNNNSSLLNYSVAVKKGVATVSTLTVSPSATVTVSTVTYPGVVVTGLELGQSYTFVVSATNGIGSTSAAATPALTPAVAPGAPTLVSVVRGSLSATVNWTAPASNGGSVITGYAITCTAGSTTVSGTGTATGTSAVVTKLVNGTTYTCSVAAKNAVGTSVASSTQTVTPATVPGAPTGAAGVAGNGQVTVNWVAPVVNGGAAITGYSITVKAGAIVVKTVNAGASDHSAVIAGLTNGTAYTFSIVATNAVGNSTAVASKAVTPSTTPGAPTVGITAQTSATSLTFNWTAPSSTGGSAVTGYEIKVFSKGVQVGAAKTAAATAKSLIVTGLTTKTAYTFTVAAKNVNGTGSASAASVAVSTK